MKKGSSPRSSQKLPFLTTCFWLLFCEQRNGTIFRKGNPFLLLIAYNLSQRHGNRLLYFNLLCLLAKSGRLILSVKYYFLKLIRASFHRLAFFYRDFRCLFLSFESLHGEVSMASFTMDFFIYDKDFLTPPLVIPFNRYLLRLDVYSFFFLWAAMEGIRISFYNGYLKAHPALWSRPSLRHCFTQAWFPRRWCYVPLRGLTILHLPQFNGRSISQILRERFSIMFFAKKYIIVHLVHSKSHYFRQVQFPPSLKFWLSNDSTLAWLVALRGSSASTRSFCTPWDWQQIFRLYFLFFMQYPKRYPLEKWLLPRYSMYYTRALCRAPDSSELYLNLALRDYSFKFTRSFYIRLFTSQYLQHSLFLKDLYHYNSFSWEAFASFIDRHFCYRVLSLKFNWFFDRYFLEAHSHYIALTFPRPFQRKNTATLALPRRRTLFFAKRFLLRLCALPLSFSYTLLGLEYFYWRIYEPGSVSRWMDHYLPLYYYYIKLNVDRLLVSRYRTMLHWLRAMPPNSVNESSYLVYNYQNPLIFHFQRWLFPRQCHHFNPWILLYLSALKSIVGQSFSLNPRLALLSFYLLRRSLLLEANVLLSDRFSRRCLASFENAQKFYNFIFADQKSLAPLGVDWAAPRAKRWLAPFSEKDPQTMHLESRYGANYEWLLKNKQGQID